MLPARKGAQKKATKDGKGKRQRMRKTTTPLSPRTPKSKKQKNRKPAPDDETPEKVAQAAGKIVKARLTSASTGNIRTYMMAATTEHPKMHLICEICKHHHHDQRNLMEQALFVFVVHKLYAYIFIDLSIYLSI